MTKSTIPTLLFVILMASISYMYTVLGLDWIYVGYGLNPWLSFPMAALSLFIGIYLPWYLCRLFKEEDEPITDEQAMHACFVKHY